MTLTNPELEPRFRDAKLRALAEFAAGAGHEINNPVATIVGYVQQLLPGESDPDRILALQTIGAQAYRIRDMIGDVMLFARPPQPRPVSVDLSAIARDVIAVFVDEAESRAVTLENQTNAELPILADATQLRVLLSELLRNALLASSPGGRIVLETSQFVDAGLPTARLTVSDDGTGIPESVLPHLFDPFFSGRQAGRGLGFGLAKAWRIADLHHARLFAQCPGGRGAVFTLHWPQES